MMADIPRRKPMPAGYSTPPQLNAYTHSRSRTTSSNIFPTILYPPQQQLQQQQQQQQQQQPQFPINMQTNTYPSRRTPSTNTFSTTASSGNGPAPFRNSSADLKRSTSSRSGGPGRPTGYVALMRRQKATVWCDRAQHEDPRLLAAQRAAKKRAAMEVIGGGGPTRVSTSGSGSLGGNRVTAKIRHHGKAGLVGYSPGDLVGGVGGVPMRLSASEVEGGDSDDEDAASGNVLYHRRTGSGRSSLGSGRKGLTYRQSGASSVTGRWSSGNTPPSERERLDSMEDVAEAGETPMPVEQPKGKDYFAIADGNGDGTASAGSGSSGERNDKVEDLGSAQVDAARLASNSLLQSTVTREKSLRNPEDLRRRGSVDERTMTLSVGRLYIANPDADSD